MTEIKKTKVKQKEWRVSGISRKFPTYRNTILVSNHSWLDGKRKDDEAEGLWRIHDYLYDFNDFVDQHPGGALWLTETKGTDITESFESHHLSLTPEKLLSKYKIRKAKNPRNYTFTLHDDGFYRTLKSRVRQIHKQLDQSPRKTSDLIHFNLMLSTLAFSLLTAKTDSIIYKLLAGLSLSLLTIVAHNYFHQKDNWRMYTFNFSLMNFTSWRISHALSHHAYPNSMHDLEMSLFEPFLCWIPNPFIASKLHRIISVIIQPIFYTVIFPFEMLNRIVYSIQYKNILRWHDLIAFTLPTLMCILTDTATVLILKQWIFIILVASFIFGLIGLNAAHHDPKIYHDGDANRIDRDWGLYQIDTIIERGDIRSSHFLVLASFGDHILHHLFPTLDHGLLPQLYPVFEKTLKDFKVDISMCTQIDHIIGQNKQLLRTTANPIPPGFTE